MYISTAVIAGDYLYTYNDVGVPGCYEWKTGKELWKDQIEKRPGGTTPGARRCMPTGRIYITDQEGSDVRLRRRAQVRVAGLNRLNERCNASIAVAGGNLFIRTHKHLWCIGKGE